VDLFETQAAFASCSSAFLPELLCFLLFSTVFVSDSAVFLGVQALIMPTSPAWVYDLADWVFISTA